LNSGSASRDSGAASVEAIPPSELAVAVVPSLVAFEFCVQAGEVDGVDVAGVALVRSTETGLPLDDDGSVL
jgi:hypothetical protein